MDATILVPSPNWFQVSILSVSQDGWLIYGGPSKSLCILEPINPECNGVFKSRKSYRAHVVNRAHLEKIVSVDFSKEWSEKKLFLTGSADGSVKQWSLENFKNSVKVKSTHSHDIHSNEKEEIAGLGYSTEVFAITVGSYGNVVKWDLKSNVVRSYNQFLKSFKPTCVECSHHVPLNVAVGTKQGVVFVLDLNGNGKIVFKVRGQDDDIVNLSWCPQYEVILKRTFRESKARTHLTKKLEESKNKDCQEPESLNDTTLSKSLPEDSFDESIVQEDDTFDIYKDHEVDEFGHKKFQPIDIIVKIKEEAPPSDFLADCLKLKEQILRKKNDHDSSIATLVDTLDKTHVDGDNFSANLNKDEEVETKETLSKKEEVAEPKNEVVESRNMEESSSHVYRHLLATIGKYGGVRLWSKSGRIVGSCVVPNVANKIQKYKGPVAATLLWYKPDVLLIADGKSQLLECNPIRTDCRNKLDWKVVHSLHKRGLYAMATNAPRIQQTGIDIESDDWVVWTIAQDRNLICYSMERKEKMAVYNTSGGFVYNIQHCPYDAKKIAMSVGDGAVRVWDTDTLVEDDSKLSLGRVTSFWQNVQGKVLTVAWHPTKENLLAFGTAEARVGLIDTSGKAERPARALPPALRGGVYSLRWGPADKLYACGGGVLVVYETCRFEKEAVHITVKFEGKEWSLSSVLYDPRGLVCGSINGAVAVLDPNTYEVITGSFLYAKMIHMTEWHPQQSSSSSEDSIHKDLIAVSSLDRSFNIVLVEFCDKGDGPKLHTWKTLSGHKASVLQICWNPHNDVQLMSTSHDGTVRVWDVSSGACTNVYGGHAQASLSACFSLFPSLSTLVISGGTDCCLRLWDLNSHTPDLYTEIHHQIAPKVDKKNKAKRAEVPENSDSKVATTCDTRTIIRPSKKYLLPVISKQTSPCTVYSVRRMLMKYWSGKNKSYETENATSIAEVDFTEDDTFDFIKIFGSTNDVNTILDMEVARHLQCDRWEACVVLYVLRGHVSSLLDLAAAREKLCPFILSLAPTVSHKYWKDAIQTYLGQIDRVVAKGEEEKLNEEKYYGGPFYRKMCLQLCSHDVLAAVNTLWEGKLFKEAYVLARSRHMDSVAEDTLRKWAMDCMCTGVNCMAAVCFLALDDPYQAAIALSKTDDEELLSMASQLAKEAGQPTFASHIEEKKSLIKNESTESEQELKELPSKIDLMIDSIDCSQVHSE